MKPEPVDISAEVKSICEALDLEYHHVAELLVLPGEAKVTVYLQNEDGKKYVDRKSGLAVMSVVTLPAVA